MFKPMAGLRWRVFLLLLCTGAVMLAASVYRAVEHRTLAIDTAVAQQNALSAALADKQRLGIEGSRRLLALLTRAVDLAGLMGDPRCAQVLGGFIEHDPQVANLFLVRPDGLTLCNQAGAAPSLNISDRDFVPRALGQPGPVIGAAQVGRFTGKRVLPVAQRIEDASGQVRGLIVVALDLGWVIEEAGRAVHGEALIGLIDAQGRVVARRAEPGGLIEAYLAGPVQARRPGAGGSPAPQRVVLRDGVRRLLTFYRFADTLGGPIDLYLAQPEAAITAAADRQMQVDIVLAVLLVAVAFSVAWYGGEIWLVRPIRMISAAAQRLGAGDHLARSGVAGRRDEIGTLAATFDQMAEALASSNHVVRLNRALQLLSKSNQTLVRGVSEAALLDEVCRIAVEVGGYRMAWVGFAEADAEQSVRLIAQHGADEGYLQAVRISWGDNALGKGPTGTAIRSATPQINRNFATEKNVSPWRATALAHGFRSSAAFPLRVEGRVLGALTVYSAAADAFNEQEVALLCELADDLAFGIHSRRVQQAHDQALRRLEQVLEATVQAVATTVEFRDPYTAGHQRRVAALAVAIARRLGLPEAEVQGIHLAGIVHDIGKIQVPEAILAKPGRLSEAEYAVLRRHPEAGHEILKDIAFPWPIAEMVLQHHERLDGSGYPRALRAEQIIPGARILAVADVVEAMMLDRPYRPGLGLPAALDEVRQGRGLRYDAQVVDACEALMAGGEFVFEAA